MKSTRTTLSRGALAILVIFTFAGLTLSACADTFTDTEPPAPGGALATAVPELPTAEDPSPTSLAEGTTAQDESLPEEPTPSFKEGNDLDSDSEGIVESPIDLFTAPVTAAGELLIVSGQVLDRSGNPLEGAAVEFWQTDTNGIYDHPGDSSTQNRDPGFQFYGTSITDAQGRYAFRTIAPGRYEPRPPHIHTKVKWNGAELLTSQIYFAEVGAEGGFGSGADQLLLVTEMGNASDGTPVQVGLFEFVVDTGSRTGKLNPTPSQGEGPYYPVINVGDFDNDLASITN